MLKALSPKSILISVAAAFAIAASVSGTSAQAPSPRSVLGFTPGESRTIADWGQITGYFERLDKASRKVTVQRIGTSTLGRPMIAAFISSERNIRDLEQYRRISAKLADPRTVGAAELSGLIRKGKTIVAISCSIHSTEIVPSQMSMSLAFELATATDPETKEILDNTILILLPSPNPDGVDSVASWYRKTLGRPSEGTNPPELYHHYAGHDNNRDWFMLNLTETRAVTNLFWKQWFPQIVYDIHQQGKTGARFTLPPFYDPVNPRIDPALLRDVGALGYKMAADLQAAGERGVATNSLYDTWWHGGFRSAPYFHNSIGILSEAASADLMTPVNVSRESLRSARPVRGLPSLVDAATNFPDPWPGGEWTSGDIARLQIRSSRSLLQMAAKFRGRYLSQFYEYGRRNLRSVPGDPEAFIIAAGQPDSQAVGRLVEILMAQGIEVHEMTSEAYVKQNADDKEFHEMPLGGFMVLTSQPQRLNILSLFERQKYPQRLTAAGEAEVPYDVAGWTLPLQMGVETMAVAVFRDRSEAMRSLRPVTSIDAARAVLDLPKQLKPFAAQPNPLRSAPRIGLYRGRMGSMDEGWTRYVLDTFSIPFVSVTDAMLRSGDLPVDALILPADSEDVIVKGLPAARYGGEYAGGIGAEGAENLKRFVSVGGRLICFDDSCGLAIKKLELPITNTVSGLRRSEFYNPGSIVGITLDRGDPLTAGMPANAAAYFSNSSAFDAEESPRLRIAARYAARDTLMSGWMIGDRYIAGKAALIEAKYGKGSVVLFGFRPQHRGQSWGTFRLIFNALEK